MASIAETEDVEDDEIAVEKMLSIENDESSLASRPGHD